MTETLKNMGTAMLMIGGVGLLAAGMFFCGEKIYAKLCDLLKKRGINSDDPEVETVMTFLAGGCVLIIVGAAILLGAFAVAAF